MDISSLGIPNIRTTKVGSGRDRIEMVVAVIGLMAGYLVEPWEQKALRFTDGTIGGTVS